MRRLPAEWESQSAVWLVYPRDPMTWPNRLDNAQHAIIMAAKAITRSGQPVNLLVDPQLEATCRQKTRSLGPLLNVIPLQYQDSWIRDYGPITVLENGQPAHLKFRFDAWGGKYESLMHDNEVVRRLGQIGAIARFEEIDFVLEGGALETDGQGTFLATRSVCRGRGQTAEEFAETLRQYLGARKVIWLEDGIQGDDTDGHIDTITRFVGPAKVVTTVAPEGHPDYANLAANLRDLQGATDADGRALEIIELPPAPTLTTDDGEPLPAGYANFLITNKVVLVPSFDHENDAIAARILASCFPGRSVVQIDHQDLIWGMGGIHCLSMQVPAPQ